MEAGVFDTSSSTPEYVEGSGMGNIEGSSLTDNYFAQIKFQPEGRGVYAVLGAEERYVGDQSATRRRSTWTTPRPTSRCSRRCG